MADGAGSPMSATSTTPANERPGSSTSPGLSAANVTVADAAMTGPSAWPVNPSTPLGMSTASTGVLPGSGGDHVPRKPVP